MTEPHVAPAWDGLPPLPAVGMVGIQIWAAVENYRWDSAKWDEGLWAGQEWRDVTAQIMNAQISWGADDNQGALSVPAAGSWSLVTYDPQRLLDPENYESPFASFLRPGGLCRIIYRDSANVVRVVRKGYIDEVEFDMASKQGRLRGSDGISLMVKTKMRESQALAGSSTPYSLRARARWVLDKVGIGAGITVEPDPPEGDPPVGLLLDAQSSAWQQIATAAFDASHGVWLDRNGVIRFRHFGDKSTDDVVEIGGKFSTSIAMETLGSLLSMEGVYNHVIGYSDLTVNEPTEYEARDEQSIQIYGDLLLRRERQNPDVEKWVANMLADRGSTVVQFVPGTIRIQSESSLEKILNAGVGTQVGIHVADARHGPSIHKYATLLGGSIEVNVDTGWSANLNTYIPAGPMLAQSPFKMRRYSCSVNQQIFQNQDGTDGYRNQYAELEVMSSPMTDPEHSVHQVLLNFPAIDWNGITKLHSARLRFYRPHHTDDAGTDFVDAGWFKFQRLTAAFSESTEWPGPGVTSEGERPFFIDQSGDVWVDEDISWIVRDWAPLTVENGKAQPQHGIKISHYFGTLSAGYSPEHMFFMGRRSSLPIFLWLKVE